MTYLQELHQRKSGFIKDMRSILDKAKQEKRNLIDEENQKYESIRTQVEDLNQQITREEQLAGFEQNLEQPSCEERHLDLHMSLPTQRLIPLSA